MTIDYAAIAESTLAALIDAGMAMTLTTPGTPTYDPATGAATATPTSYAAVGVKLPAGQLKGLSVTFSQEVTAQATAYALLAASGLAVSPAPGCSLAIGSDVFQVIGADTLAPAGVAVLHAVALVK